MKGAQLGSSRVAVLKNCGVMESGDREAKIHAADFIHTDSCSLASQLMPATRLSGDGGQRWVG